MVQLSVYKKSTWIYEYFYISKYFFNPCIPFNAKFTVGDNKSILVYSKSVYAKIIWISLKHFTY